MQDSNDPNRINVSRLTYECFVFLAVGGWIMVAFLLGILLGEGPRR